MASTSSIDKCTCSCEAHADTAVAGPAPPARANVLPLGMFAFATGFLLSALFALHTRGVIIPNVIVSIFLFYGGVIQFIVGIYELMGANGYTATLFLTYASFNIAYAGLFLPALGIAQAYMLPDGTLSPQFAQATGLFIWVWFIPTTIFLIGSLRSSASLVFTLFATDMALAFLGMAQFTGGDTYRIIGGSFSLMAAVGGYWAGMAGWLNKDGLGFKQIVVRDFSLAYGV